jgi:glycerol-3-phosphate acyltransferase PlsY
VALSIIITGVLGYLLGSIPFGYIMARARGIDIREHGSGNIGATNVTRTIGKGAGVFVFICDASKGLAAVQFGTLLTHHTTAEIVGAICAIVGHNFPVWLKFKGGKGIATSAGALIGLVPYPTLVAALVWAAVFFTTRYVSLASIAAAISLPLAVWGLIHFAHHGNMILVWFSVLVAVLAVWRHRGNIARLLNGTENRFGRSGESE